MQQITTRDWTQITGLDSEKTYILQAQVKRFDSSNVFGVIPVNVMWLQAAAAPAADTVGMIDNKLKASAASAIYVKSSLDCEIVVQEVI